MVRFARSRTPRQPSIAVALVVAAAAGPVGCGGGDDARSAVNRYVERANAAQQRHATGIERANAASRAFASRDLASARAGTAIGVAERAVRAARRDVAAMRPPPAARTLHARLLRYLDMSVVLAEETTRLADLVYSRATLAAGFSEASFSAQDHNRIELHAR